MPIINFAQWVRCDYNHGCLDAFLMAPYKKEIRMRPTALPPRSCLTPARRLLMGTALAGFLACAAAPALAAPGMGQPLPNSFWWPEQLDLSALRDHDASANPYDDFNYAEEFKKLDLAAVKKDINALLTTSQPWWPADYGNYGPFFIRMAWHSAGTYRTIDGRGGAGGGQQRFDPQNSWPDNASLDKARRLLWPVKQKYGRQISWADLMVLTGNVAMENMGFKTLGFAGGRADDWEPDLVYWGSEKKFLDAQRRDKEGKLKGPLAAVQMGLIYVNPEGPNSNHDPVSAAHDIRESFGRMAMNDEEIVALIAGGHTFGKAHGAVDHKECIGAEPAAAGTEAQGFGWSNRCGKGNAEHTFTSGLEGAWTSAPAQWTHQYLTNLFAFDWKQSKSPAGAVQWVPTDASAAQMVPDAHIEGKFHAPIMFTTDLALKEDPAFRAIAERFHKDPQAFEQAFAQAWFKLTHRDMGPQARYIGAAVPKQTFLWQDPLPKAEYKQISDRQVRHLKEEILASGLTVPELVRTAWAAASSFRASDMRGGANGGRVRLEPQRNWPVNDPAELARVLSTLENIQADFNDARWRRSRVSLADLVVIGGAAAIEKAAQDAGIDVTVPVVPGRVDASQQQTDIEAFAVLEPMADGFRNYYSDASYMPPAEMLVDKADLLDLSVPEMTALVGGMRVLGANSGGVTHGVFTARPGQLSNDFFVNLLSMETQWKKSDREDGLYVGVDRATGAEKWTATPVDLVFGSNSELRAIAEVYASQDGKRQFIEDFIQAWNKVMNADRFDT